MSFRSSFRGSFRVSFRPSFGGIGSVAIPAGALLFNDEPLEYNSEILTYNP